MENQFSKNTLSKALFWLNAACFKVFLNKLLLTANCIIIEQSL